MSFYEEFQKLSQRDRARFRKVLAQSLGVPLSQIPEDVIDSGFLKKLEIDSLDALELLIMIQDESDWHDNDDGNPPLSIAS